jgi:ArsR family transcriptional regulator
MENEEIISEIFKILSNPTRLKILKALKEENLCQCELAEKLKENPVNISRALSAFEKLDIVNTEKKGQRIFPEIKIEKIFELLDLAEEISKEIVSSRLENYKKFLKKK